MNARTKWYIAAVTLGGILCAAALYVSEPTIPTDAIAAVAILSTFALIAEVLSVVLPNSVAGSLGFIPYLSAALIAPNWIALLGMVAVRGLVEVMSRRS